MSEQEIRALVSAAGQAAQRTMVTVREAEPSGQPDAGTPAAAAAPGGGGS
jgi:hypothetical protein